MTSSRFGRLAPGVRDMLPAEAHRLRNLKEAFCDLVTGWGYREVVTPSFEYIENLASEEIQEDKFFKFLDRQGHLMALRPDMTRPIARLVATRMKGIAPPLRLFYLANVFNYEQPQVGRQREFCQAGVELLGASSPEADAEVVALVTEYLRQSGLGDFQISIGHVGIFHGLVKQLGLPKEVAQELKDALGNKDFVKVEKFLASHAATPEEARRALDLIELRGGPAVLDKAAELAQEGPAADAVENLRQLYQGLTCYGLAGHITLDLGLLRGLDYYTGLVFEGYTVAMGFPICGGGRYNQLLAHFGYPMPATGFAVNLERVLVALERLQGPPAEPVTDVLVAWENGSMAQALQTAQALRKQGLKVATALFEYAPARARAEARSLGAGRVIYCFADGTSQELASTP
ncbi:ATP phosphoribosyltransferase regulatory subunit [Desulforamulus hydrothermalis]|uniref:ATP phosphoribosyltransferase regulatory subunit n=1 Tax=Desulforamulus hydrothermalis Lam5 = DSM 18033 TaxID=1121428 RepID=K8E0S5_9FIRM|nr:ATP phosphoribosyltransferase regulatory subunit [Desulforamulus hydrothermalis]CCO09234.1 ATP phosphoribosyltransferase regulatory subunit [Desulforamulus hydrothermalis Lam5 = DSM 18033]SHH05932.1 ATP phosphoribosyltransferase regulatory subunit [Desulforamulus hydrothermalis Lam5 = DSM 18033]